jgi:hypothetical protein
VPALVYDESMDWLLHLIWPAIVVAIFSIAALEYRRYRGRQFSGIIRKHFSPLLTDQLAIAERKFPFRVRADLQGDMRRMFDPSAELVFQCGLWEDMYSTPSIADLANDSQLPRALKYEELDIGEAEPVRVVKSGLWLLREGASKYGILLAPAYDRCGVAHMQFQIATPDNDAGHKIVRAFFKRLEDSVLRGDSYRGKVLSFDASESYSGHATGIQVHTLRAVAREQVILPKQTLDLLDRNVIRFVEQRKQLCHFGQAIKKGLLFYGPPGTGKTHTIHYLAGALQDHTTLLISAEQVAYLSEYMTLARLLQPSMVVIEDADLIARDRAHLDSPAAEVLLNKLLNEMDGLRPDAEVLFILTTNRPQTLEQALAARPGRIDQAIEFPLPDEDGRRKLLRLYSHGLRMSDDLTEDVVGRTARVSAAFIRELMRRSAQFHIERKGNGELESVDVKNALDEMIFHGGSLNAKLLGAQFSNGGNCYDASDCANQTAVHAAS